MKCPHDIDIKADLKCEDTETITSLITGDEKMSSELWTEGESYSSMCSKPTPHLDAFLHVQTKDSPSEKRLSIPDPFDGLEQLAAPRGLSLDHKHVSFSPPGAINSHIAQRNHSHFFFLIVQLLNSCNYRSFFFFQVSFSCFIQTLFYIQTRRDHHLRAIRGHRMLMVTPIRRRRLLH